MTGLTKAVGLGYSETLVGEPLRVCQFTPTLWSGGSEERIARVMAHLPRHRFRFSWMGFGAVREDLIAKAGPHVTAYPVDRHPTAGIQPSLIPNIVMHLRRIRPHLVHVHNWSTSIYGIAAARLAGVPAVLYEFGGLAKDEVPSARRQRLMQTLAPQVDHFTAVCEFLGQQLQDYWHLPPDRITVAPTGVDFSRVDRAPKKEAARKKFGLPVDAEIIGTVSVLRAVKRIEDLIEAAGKLAKTRPNLHLVLAGDARGLSFDDLRRHAAEVGLKDRLHLLGRVEDTAAALACFDVFINCSDFEGLSNAIIEAMAMRIPVVVTAVGGSPELVTEGQTGRLVPPRQPALLADAIDKTLSEPNADIIERAYTKVRSECSIDTMVDAYRDIYTSTYEMALGRQSMAFASSGIQSLQRLVGI